MRTNKNKKSDISSKKKTDTKETTKQVPEIDLKNKELESNAQKLLCYNLFVKNDSNYDINRQIKNYEEVIQNNVLAEMFIKEKILELKLDIKSYAYDDDSQIDNIDGNVEKDYYRIGFDSAVQNRYNFERMPNDEFQLKALPHYAKGRLHAYLIDYFETKLKHTKDLSENQTPVANSGKLLWLAKPEQFGFIFSELARLGYYQFATSNGEASISKTAKMFCNLFEFRTKDKQINDNPKENIERALNAGKNRLSDSNRAKFTFPDAKEIS